MYARSMEYDTVRKLINETASPCVNNAKQRCLDKWALRCLLYLTRRIIKRKALGMQNIVRHICCHDRECQVLAKICMYK